MKLNRMLLLLIIAFTSAGILAQNRHGDNPVQDGKAPMRKLNLTEQQQKTFSDLSYKHQQSLIDIRSQIQKNRLEINKMLQDNSIDEKRFINLTDENSKLQLQIRSKSVQHWMDIYKILDADQQKKWNKVFRIMGEKEGCMNQCRSGKKAGHNRMMR